MKHVDMVEGERSKRYGMAYGGDTKGSYDTATELFEAFRSYEDKIRPVIDPRKKYRYSFRDGRNTITIEDLRRIMAAESAAKRNAPSAPQSPHQ